MLELEPIIKDCDTITWLRIIEHWVEEIRDSIDNTDMTSDEKYNTRMIIDVFNQKIKSRINFLLK